MNSEALLTGSEGSKSSNPAGVWLEQKLGKASRFEIVGEPGTFTLAEFERSNRDAPLDWRVMEAISRLDVGAAVPVGGGACGDSLVRRVA